MVAVIVATVLGNWLLPVMVVMIAIAIVVVFRVMATRYKKIPPNAVGIFYGRKYTYIAPDGTKQTRGFRLVAGGGSLLWPIVEQLQVMSTAAFQTEIDEAGIPNKDNVKINVKGVATCKISAIPEDLGNAAGAFLGKTEKEIGEIVTNILKGHLRSIIGKLDISEILRERDTFNRRVMDESTDELKRLGIHTITLVIQEVNDELGYIVALGKRAVAEAVRDANIKVAEAERDAQIKVSNALREAEVVKASNAVAIAEAERDRDVKRAQFKVVADTELAKSNQALGIATADQERVLKVKQAERDAAEKEAQTKVQKQEAERKQQELEATVVRVANAEKQKLIIQAEAAKQSVILQAEAEMESRRTRAEGEKQANVLQGEGEASKTRATMLAQADGQAAMKRQTMIAEAEGQAAMRGKVLMAEAEGEAAKKGKVLLAEAEGTQKLAEALAKMTESAKLILILDRLPNLFEKGGDAFAKVASATFSSVAAPLGNIDEIRIIDVGGSGRGLDQLSQIVPNTVFKTLASMKAQGVDVSQLLSKLGVNIVELDKMLGAHKAVAPPPSAPQDPQN